MSKADENLDALEFFLLESASAFDSKAAESATHEQATKYLKVLKHYARVAFGNRNVNRNLKFYLNCLGIEPEVPGSVVGGYEYALDLLKLEHKCTGKDCVKKYKQQSSDGENFLTRMKGTNIKTKASVRQQKKKNPDKAPGAKQSKEFLSYMI
ncbi:hypothetical protein AVEN_34639-1 [Araneus ventricosus]|uniref:Uncharacterized protein n=1 Tax=Araneus ventricosus TaxID=182803 RepID=A0A4Y2B077_ARAVE|nr:hypothetical protein AVEN_34639-1 [Araneus ventricosus]